MSDFVTGLHGEHRFRSDGATAAEVLGGSGGLRVSRSAPMCAIEESPLLKIIRENADGILVVSPDGRMLFVNPAAQTLLGRSSNDLIGTHFGFPLSHDGASEIDILRPDGETCTAEMRLVESTWGGQAALIVSLRDVTDRKRLEEQLRHAQKMEALGRLAGGIAHDFNNMLTSILCQSSVLVEELGDDDHRCHYADQIRRTAARASDLTNQLLAFSRKQVVQPQIIELTTIVAEMERLLRPLIGEDIEVVSCCTGLPTHVQAGRGQIEQIIMNLAVNARDAMPDGGTLSIETSVVKLCPPSTEGGISIAPRHVALTVRDTGCGMDDAVLAHLFEPFYTTKDDGRGTGLGLSVVYGIVQQLDGRITVSSEMGRGTTFQVLLPLVEDVEPPETVRPPHICEGVSSGEAARTVLLAEDEEAIRDVIEEILEREGYSVLSAPDGLAALELLQQQQEPVDLLVSDVTMPRMNGAQLAQRVIERHPGTPVLFLSGYPTGEAVQETLNWKTVGFLSKPFSPGEFLHNVRKLLLQAAPTRLAGEHAS